MSQQNEITFREAIQRVVSELTGPISMDEFVRRVLEIRPSIAKNPRQSVTQVLWEHEGTILTRLDRNTIVPLHAVMPGVRFRWLLSREEAEQGALRLNPTFFGYLPRSADPASMLSLIDEHGKEIKVRRSALQTDLRKEIEELAENLPIPVDDIPDEILQNTYPALDLADWMRAHQVEEGDSILFTIVEWGETRRAFQIAHEPYAQIEPHFEHIFEQSRLMESTLFDMLEHEHDEALWMHHAIPRMHVILDGPRDLPGLHWTTAVIAGNRMLFDDLFIFYADSRRGLAMLGVDSVLDLYHEDAEAPQETNRVLRFKVWYRRKKSRWERIEIREDQTFYELDAIIRLAFDHDPGDHLGGFWKWIRRDETKRFRKVSVGVVYPFFPDATAINDRTLSELRLEVGDQLLYVYDFGDWVEHILELEAIEELEPKVTYPRVLPKPRGRGRKRVS